MLSLIFMALDTKVITFNLIYYQKKSKTANRGCKTKRFAQTL